MCPCWIWSLSILKWFGHCKFPWPWPRMLDNTCLTIILGGWTVFTVFTEHLPPMASHHLQHRTRSKMEPKWVRPKCVCHSLKWHIIEVKLLHLSSEGVGGDFQHVNNMRKNYVFCFTFPGSQLFGSIWVFHWERPDPLASWQGSFSSPRNSWGWGSDAGTI